MPSVTLPAKLQNSLPRILRYAGQAKPRYHAFRRVFHAGTAVDHAEYLACLHAYPGHHAGEEVGGDERFLVCARLDHGPAVGGQLVFAQHFARFAEYLDSFTPGQSFTGTIGKFKLDPLSGNIVFAAANCPREYPLNCWKICNPTQPNHTTNAISNVVSASATTSGSARARSAASPVG